MPRRGAEHHNARLTDAQVQAMRVIYQGWKDRGLPRGYGRAATLFSCSRATARDIIQRRTRANV